MKKSRKSVCFPDLEVGDAEKKTRWIVGDGAACAGGPPLDVPPELFQGTCRTTESQVTRRRALLGTTQVQRLALHVR